MALSVRTYEPLPVLMDSGVLVGSAGPAAGAARKEPQRACQAGPAAEAHPAAANTWRVCASPHSTRTGSSAASRNQTPGHTCGRKRQVVAAGAERWRSGGVGQHQRRTRPSGHQRHALVAQAAARVGQRRGARQRGLVAHHALLAAWAQHHQAAVLARLRRLQHRGLPCQDGADAVGRSRVHSSEGLRRCGARASTRVGGARGIVCAHVRAAAGADGQRRVGGQCRPCSRHSTAD